MSVRVLSQVFSRYPSGGGEMLLALALADHADDSGENIFPKIETLADKTRQSARTVQRQLRAMEEQGWLIPVGRNHGGRGMASRYRISPAWIKGDRLSPFNEKKGDSHDKKGRHPRQKRVTPVSPAKNRQEPSPAPTRAHESAGAHAREAGEPLPDPIDVIDASGDERSAGEADEAALAWIDVVTVLQSHGTPWHWCTSDASQRVIRSWLALGLSMSGLTAALSRAHQHKRDGPVGPAYLDPIVKQVFQEQSGHGGQHAGSSRRRESSVDVLWRNAALSQ